VVNHFTIKPVLYGSLAAKFARVGRVINSITGLGHVFITNAEERTCYGLLPCCFTGGAGQYQGDLSKSK
jgi:hypothetical protein